MPSSFASQLQAIAANSTHELDLKARRAVHGESLLFERPIAVKQHFNTIYNICLSGFHELCQLDSRFEDFNRNLFSEQSKDEDREQMTKSENEALDLVLKRCLTLLGRKLLLKPAQKALEWLVRRFKVHIYNVDDLLCAVLPYHEVTIWANVLSIIPNEKIVGTWKFIRPYLKTTWNVPRHAVAYAAANNDGFFTLMNNYVLQTCQAGFNHPQLMRFWSSLVVEAIATRLNQTRSGRKEVQNQRTEDLLRKILPLLSDGFEVVGTEDLTTTCYTITIVLAAKADLADHLLDSLMLAVVQTLQRADHDAQQAFVTMLVLANHKKDEQIPRKVLDILAQLEAFNMIVQRMAEQHTSRSFLLLLVKSAMSQIKRKNARRFAGFADILIRLTAELYTTDSLSEAVQPMVAKILQLDPEKDKEAEVRQELILRLQSLNEVESLSVAIASAANELKHDAHTLENILGMTISLPREPLKIEDADGDLLMADSAPQNGVEDIFASLPQSWSPENCFLAFHQSDEYEALAEAFEKSYGTIDLQEQFSRLPVWKSGDEQEVRWQTFLLRFACTGRSVTARTRALVLLAQSIKAEVSFHLQTLLPYILTFLADAKQVRKAALSLLMIIKDKMTPTTEDVHSHHVRMYPSGKLFDLHNAAEMQSLISDVVEPVSEECLLDSTYVGKVVHDALESSTHSSKKSHKSVLGSLLIQHTLATPLIKVKVSILNMLRDIRKIGKHNKVKTLFPVLQEWSAFSTVEAQAAADEAGMTISEIDSVVVKLADVHDKHFFEHFAEHASSEDSTYRHDLVFALFAHLRTEWSIWTIEQQQTIADTLFDLALSTSDVLASAAQDVLRNVDLPTEVLASLIKQSQAGTSEVRAPASKRRKRSSSSSGTTMSRTDAIKSIDNATAKISLALELVDSNAPESKTGLIDIVFELLASIRQLQQNGVDSPYLLNLCLSILHSTVNPARLRGETIKSSNIKPEVVTDCLRNSDNLQVQTSALLLLAALSTIVPDRMVHNVMPVFTFIGHNMLYKDDEHSVNVINEAIDKIVPALMENLRRGRNVQHYQSSVTTMLASFTAAYDHIPLHRRVGLYQKLLSCINADDFGYMLVALVSHQQRKDQGLTKLVHDLMAASAASTQLKIYRQLLQVAVDVLSASPKISVTLFNIQKSTTHQEKLQYAAACLGAASKVLASPTLAAQVQKGSKSRASDNITGDIQTSFRVTLSSIQATKSAKESISGMVKQCMDVLLRLPGLSDLLDALSLVLDDMPADLKPQALRILALQFTSKKTKDSRAQQVSIDILAKLHQYLQSSTDDSLLLASLACVDRIVEAYGRKEPDAVLAAAQHILENIGLASHKHSEKSVISTILTIASFVEVLKEASIPLVSVILQQAGIAFEGFTGKAETSDVFNALCTLLSSVISNVSFVIAQDQLNEIIGRVINAQTAYKDEDEGEYEQFKKAVARKVDLDMTVSAISTQLNDLVDAAPAVEYFSLLSQAIESSPKSAVIKSAELISQIILSVLELTSKKTTLKPDDQTIYNSIASQLNDTTIKFIYKINDTTFRPIFESWVDWATSTTRQIVLFELLTHFFDTLKAIVTSYASYLLKPIASILESATTGKPPLPLLLNTLNLLRTAASHDQDSFFAAPSHFDPIVVPLISCLNLAVSKSTRSYVSSHVIPTIVSLATATIDSPGTHSTLTSHIVKLKSNSSSHVRLASIQTLLAMAEDEDLGDEFVANVVGTGAGEGEGARGGSVGEIMVYVNEMLEDDDEDVEMGVRKFVQVVRGKVGEDIFD